MYDKSSQYAAYNMAQRTVSKTKQIVMLYEGAMRNIRQAIDAIQANDIENRFFSLKRASEIIQGLQGCLDFNQGGEIAALLDNYYSSLDFQLLTVHSTNSVETCEKVLKALKGMRDVWEEIDIKQALENDRMPSVSAASQQPSSLYVRA